MTTINLSKILEAAESEIRKELSEPIDELIQSVFSYIVYAHNVTRFILTEEANEIKELCGETPRRCADSITWEFYLRVKSEKAKSLSAEELLLLSNTSAVDGNAQHRIYKDLVESTTEHLRYPKEAREIYENCLSEFGDRNTLKSLEEFIEESRKKEKLIDDQEERIKELESHLEDAEDQIKSLKEELKDLHYVVDNCNKSIPVASLT